MRKIIKKFTIFLLAIYLSLAILGKKIVFANFWQTPLLAALLFTGGDLLVKPIIKFLLFPLNFLTLGIIGLLTNIITIFLLTLFFQQIKILPFTTPPLHFPIFSLPSFSFSGYWSLLAFSFIIFIISRLLTWLLK